MGVQSIDYKVISRIYGHQRGWAFSKNDFLDIGGDAAIRKALSRLEEKMVPQLEEALGAHCELEIKADEKDQGHVVRVKYPKTTNTAGLLPYIQLEIGPLASWLPHSEHSVTPYVVECFPEQFDQPQCRVRAIDAERTFWEKATILHHEAHRPDDSVIPERYSRHYYDLCLMAADETLKASALEKSKLLEDERSNHQNHVMLLLRLRSA